MIWLMDYQACVVLKFKDLKEAGLSALLALDPLGYVLNSSRVTPRTPCILKIFFSLPFYRA